MKVPFHSPVRAYLAERDEIDEAVGRVLRGGRYVLGPEVERFEEEFAGFLGVDHAVGVASGTDALVLALRAAGVGPGDEVITAANAGGYTTAACVFLGASPVYADVRASDLTLDPAAVAELVTRRTKAVVLTHLYGSVGDVAGLRALADHQGLKLIEDCAQAHGARSACGRRAGSLGDFGTFSFYPTKNLGALGDGGAVVCHTHEDAQTLRELRQYGWSVKYEVKRPGGLNSRLDPVQAAVLRVRLAHLDERNHRRRTIAARYDDRLSPLGLGLCGARGESYVAHLGVIRSPDRDVLRLRLEVRGIGTDIHYPILDCDQPGWAGIGWRAGDLSVSRVASARVLSLPLYPEMTDAEVDAVCAAVQASVTTHEGVRG